MDQHSIKRVREAWYAAYYSGNVQKLYQLQSDKFKVVSPTGTQSRKSQIDSIVSAKKNGGWFPRGGSKRDIELTLQETETGCQVSGRGHSYHGDEEGPLVEFSESWEWDGSNWRVVGLSFGPLVDINK